MNQTLIIMVTVMLMSFVFSITASAQVGDVIWEDNFDTFNEDTWSKNTGDGCPSLCGWGNSELEYYYSDNVYIEEIPDESGNNALVLEAKSEAMGSSSFTSGKVDTEGKLSIQYGLIEVRMRVPDLGTGLWPAAWLLGTVNLDWPACGEIDMMEMGHALEERTNQGYPSSTTNNYVGANAIFLTEDGNYGSIAYDVDYNQPYVAETDLNDRFVTYRLYWEPTQMRYTVVDNGVEYDLYTNPLPIEDEGNTEAFTRPFYFLLNLAVGGTFTDATSVSQVTAPMPGKMYVDYVRVYEYNGYGEVTVGDDQVTESGVFGVFTDETATNNSLNFGSDSEIYVWGNTMQDGSESAYEGDNVISWETLSANSWFGGGIVSLYGKDMSNYPDNGTLKFKIKIPADVSFKIGITDNYTNEQYVDFPAGETTYGLVRNGEWGQVEIPLDDFSGLIAFQDINYMFAIVSDASDLPTSTFELAIDDIVWDDGTGEVSDIERIDVSPSSASISVGETQQFTATAYDSDDNVTDATISWSTTGGSIASDGLFTGSSAGTFTITATSSSVSSTATITVNEVEEGCTVESPNGEYSIEISDDSENPTVTFVPASDGVGETLTILYYSTDEDAIFPGYIVSPNEPYQITAANGETVYLYYTYSLAEGGENNTAANKQSFVVGTCTASSARLKSDDALQVSDLTAAHLYPNPTSDALTIELPDGNTFSRAIITDVTGKTQLTVPANNVNELTMDVHTLPIGTYLLQIETEQSGKVSYRFVKY